MNFVNWNLALLMCSSLTLTVVMEYDFCHSPTMIFKRLSSSWTNKFNWPFDVSAALLSLFEMTMPIWLGRAIVQTAMQNESRIPTQQMITLFDNCSALQHSAHVQARWHCVLITDHKRQSLIRLERHNKTEKMISNNDNNFLWQQF